jgi:hypothetical protein
VDRPNGSEVPKDTAGPGEAAPALVLAPGEQVLVAGVPPPPASPAQRRFWRDRCWPYTRRYAGRATMLILLPLVAVAWILSTDAEDQNRLKVFALLLLIGLVLAWHAEFVFRIKAEKFMAFIVVLPLIYYVIDTGKIKLRTLEIAGLGKLDLAAGDSVKPGTAAKPLDVKGEAEGNVVTMVLGEGGYEAPQVLANLAQEQNRGVRYIVFVKNNQISKSDGRKRDNQFQGFLPVQVVRAQLSDPDTRDVFIQLVNSGLLGTRTTGYPLIEASITTDLTNVEALRYLLDHNLDAVAVVDVHDEPVGVVERGEILGRLALALADPNATVTPTATATSQP